MELASLDSIPNNLIANAAVLGSLSLAVAALFLIDLMGPRIYTTTHHSQTDLVSSVVTRDTSTPAQPIANGHIPNEKKTKSKPKHLTLDLSNIDMKPDLHTKKEESSLFDTPNHGYTKFDDSPDKDGLEKSKFGSLRNGIEGGNYVRLSDPLAEPDRIHYERELAKFNERYFRDYIDTIDGKYAVKEDYLPEPQTPLFAKVKSGRLKSLYDDTSPTYNEKHKSPPRHRSIASPTLQQLEDYLRSSTRSRRADTPGLFPMEPIEERDREGDVVDGRASGTPSDRGYVQYAAEKWPDKRDARTPRHSPTH